MELSMSHPVPDQILASLLEGNVRFREGRPEHPQQDPARRVDLAEGQNPKAAILSCADSRVPSELIFDQGLGDLFVVRGAGQIADETNLASLEYAVAMLGVRLIVVVGHESCGAVQAALDVEESGEPLPGHLPSGRGDPTRYRARWWGRRTAGNHLPPREEDLRFDP